MSAGTEREAGGIAWGRSADELFAGPGECAALCRALDWSVTPLGPVEEWPASLRVAAQAVIASGLPNIVLWGPELIQVYNDAYAAIIGAKHPEALGRGNREMWPEVWDINGPIFARVFAGETVTFSDALYPLERTREGRGVVENVYLTISYSPVRDADGRVGGVLANMIETTTEVQRRALEAEREQLLQALRVEQSRLATIFEQAPTFLAILRGRDHVIERANEAYLTLVGDRAVLGRTVAEALPEAAAQGFVTLLDQVLQTGTPFVGREVPITIRRGPQGESERRYLDFVYQPLVEMEEGAPRATGVVAHGYDITEQVRARLDAEEARARSDEANKAKADFLGMISHELRTPLNAIGGYAELIELGIHGPVTSDQAQALSRIRASQRHLLGLINSVLNYTRIEAGAVHYDIADVPVAEVVATCCGLVAPQASAGGLTLSVEAPDSAVVVRADREKVQQVLLNILTNAIKFTAPGGRVNVRTGIDGTRGRVEVEDTGRGIPAEQLERIFQPFVQVDAALTRTNEGVGLGLAISRDLARAMGGDLVATSELGKGSRFVLDLPVGG